MALVLDLGRGEGGGFEVIVHCRNISHSETEHFVIFGRPNCRFYSDENWRLYIRQQKGLAWKFAPKTP